MRVGEGRRSHIYRELYSFILIHFRGSQNKDVTPKPEIVSKGFCFKEVLFLIKTDALNSDLGPQKSCSSYPNRHVWDAFPLKQKTMHYCHEPNKECWVSYCLSSLGSVYVGRDEISRPQELNTLWEPSPSVVLREPNHKA